MTNAGTTASATPPRETSTCPSILGAVVAFAYEMIGRVKAAVAQGSTTYLPRKVAVAVNRNTKTAVTRIERLYALAFALTRTLAGDSHYLRRPPAPRPEAPTAAHPRRLRARRRRTDNDRERAELRRLQHIMATRPVNKIIERITSGLAIADTNDLFPIELVHVTETPAAWAQRCYGPLKPYQPINFIPPGWKPPRLRKPKTKPLAAPVAYHPRE